jgi:hypothetical protein
MGVAGTKVMLDCNESFIELIIALRFPECFPVLIVQQAGQGLIKSGLYYA